MKRLPVWLVLAVVAAAYVGVAQAGFVWDDTALVMRNRVLDAPTFENVWRRDLWCCTVSGENTGYYRPLLTVSFLLDRLIAGGIDPAVAHLQSLFWHVVVVALVAGLLRDRVGPTRAAVAALIFGLHPIQSEAVVWVAARNDLLAAAGVLAALLALDRKRPALAALAAFAACLAKENALLLPAVAWLWRRAWGERLGRADLLALGGALAAALLLRSQATLGGFSLDQQETAFDATSAFHGAVTVLGWVTWPWPLTTTASLYMGAPQWTAWPAAAATLLLVGVLLRHGGVRAAWLLALGAFVLAPSAFGVRWYATLGERYLYLPLFGLVSAIVATAPSWRGWAPVVAAGAFAALGALHVRVPDWADEESLFTAAVRRAPDGYAWALLGVELLRQDRWVDATTAFDRAIVARPPQLLACRYVADVASRILPDDAFLAHSARWGELGCRGNAGYDGAVSMVLASRGLWDEAEDIAVAARRNDTKRRDEIVRAALEARDGDLVSFANRAVVWPGGAADLTVHVASLLQARHAPRATTAGAGAGTPTEAPTAP